MDSDDSLKSFEKNFSFGSLNDEAWEAEPGNPSQALFDQYNNNSNMVEINPYYLSEHKKVTYPNQWTNTNISTMPLTGNMDQPNKKSMDIENFNDTPYYMTNNQMEIDEVNYESLSFNRNNINIIQPKKRENNMIKSEYFQINDEIKTVKTNNSNSQLNNNKDRIKETDIIPHFSQKVSNNSYLSENISLSENQKQKIIYPKQKTDILFPNKDSKANKNNELQLENELKNKKKNNKVTFITRKKGKKKKGAIYIEGVKYHDNKETGNVTLNIFRSNSFFTYIFFWNMVINIIGEENEKVKIYINKKGMFEAKLIKYDKNNKKIETIIHLASPNITELIGKPKDPNNKYHHFAHTIERYQELLEEKLITLYLKYSWPKRLPGDYKASPKKKLELIKEYQKSMNELITILLETEKNLEEKPITALLNLKTVDFMKIFINYEGKENPKKIIKVNYNDYGFNAFDLTDFKVYEDCKHNFSKLGRKQNKYRTHIIKMIDRKIKRRKTPKKDNK